jgi:hypothetical protein
MHEIMYVQPCRSASGVQVWSIGTWRTSAGSRLMDRSSRVTVHGGWHLGHELAWGRGRAERLAGTVEYWRETCQGHVGCARGAILMTVWWLSLKTILRYGWRVLLSLGLKTRWLRFKREPMIVRGVTSKDVLRRSNFVWSVWSSDRKPRFWSILPIAKWIDSM